MVSTAAASLHHSSSLGVLLLVLFLLTNILLSSGDRTYYTSHTSMFSRLFTNNALVTWRLFSSAARPLLQTVSLKKSAPTSLIIPRQLPLPPPLLPLADQLMRILYRERQQTIQPSILVSDTALVPPSKYM